MLLLGAFKGKHAFKIASYTDQTMFIYNPARGENQPKADAKDIAKRLMAFMALA